MAFSYCPASNAARPLFAASRAVARSRSVCATAAVELRSKSATGTTFKESRIIDSPAIVGVLTTPANSPRKRGHFAGSAPAARFPTPARAGSEGWGREAESVSPCAELGCDGGPESHGLVAARYRGSGARARHDGR